MGLTLSSDELQQLNNDISKLEKQFDTHTHTYSYTYTPAGGILRPKTVTTSSCKPTFQDIEIIKNLNMVYENELDDRLSKLEEKFKSHKHNYHFGYTAPSYHGSLSKTISATSNSPNGLINSIKGDSIYKRLESLKDQIHNHTHEYSYSHLAVGHSNILAKGRTGTTNEPSY